MTTETNQVNEPEGIDDIARTLAVGEYSKRRGQYLKWSGIVAAVIIIIVVAMPMVTNVNSQPIQFQTTDAVRDNLAVTVTATGTLEPVNQVEVGSEISGTIETVLVDFNDLVEQGQVLAVIDTDQLQARVNQAAASLELARANVKQAEATVTETKNSLRRSTELEKKGLASSEEYDAAQAAYDRATAALASAKAQVVAAKSSLDAEQTDLDKATIHSPISGIVLDRDVEPGQTVAASFTTPVLFQLAEDLAQMELHVDVDEADVGQVREGQDAVFTVDAYADKSFPANITEVHFASQTVDGVVTYETVLRVDNTDLLLRPGMTATADIMVKQIENALLVPNAALRFAPPSGEQQSSPTGGSLVSQLMPRPPRASERSEPAAEGNKQQVWIQRNGQHAAVPVTTGSTDGTMTEVTGGELEAGMAVIINTVSTKQ